MRLQHRALHLELSHCMLQVPEPELAPPDIGSQRLCLRLRIPQGSPEILTFLLPLCSCSPAELHLLIKPLHTPLKTLSLTLRPDDRHIALKGQGSLTQDDTSLSGMHCPACI